MQILRVGHSSANIRHICRNNLKHTKSLGKSLVLPRNMSLIKFNRDKVFKESQSDSNELTTERNGLLSRYIDSLKCNVTVWGSSVVELGVKLDYLSYLRNKNRFLIRFRNLELLSNGLNCIPNVFQLASLRPQLTGSDLLINSPKGSGKTLMYLLPHLVTNYLYNESLFNNKHLNIHQNGQNQRLIVLLPTIDLVVDESRTAFGCFRKFKKVASLLYKDLVLNNLSQVLESDIIYSTPKTFLKFLTKFPTLHNTIRFVIVDESERIASGEFASLLVRIRDLLSVDVQFVFLSNFTHNHLLHQFTSRFSKLNFKIISYLNYPNGPLKDFKNNIKSKNYNDIDSVFFSNRVTKHIYGPIRDIKYHLKIYNYINSNNTDNKENIENNNNIYNNELYNPESDNDNVVVINNDKNIRHTDINEEIKEKIKDDKYNSEMLAEKENRVNIYNKDKVINSNINNNNNENNNKEEMIDIKEHETEKECNIPITENWPLVYDLEMKIKRNLELIMNHDRNNNGIGINNKDNNNSFINMNNNYKIEYVLYEPSKFVEALLSELDINKKTLVYFPTVKMCQFCYLYFKHYLKLFSKDSIISNILNNNNNNNGRINNKNEHDNNNNRTNNDYKENYHNHKDINSNINKDNNTNNKKDHKENISEDLFIFYDFHTGLSLDKRRFVLDNFKLANRGVLFCTNLAIGVNFNNINKIIQVSFTFNIYELLNKFQFSSININNKDNNTNNKKDHKENNIERIMLLNNLDGHILYEYYKSNINVVLKRTFTETFNSYRNVEVDRDNNNNNKNNHDNSTNNDYIDTKENNENISNIYNKDNDSKDLLDLFSKKHTQNKPKMQLEWDIYLLSSCELMYRSLLGYYCENSMKLKLEKWTIPSFFNEFTSSFGISHNFKVSKQFASRTQLLNSPGLVISSTCNRKTDLMASLKSYAGFISKSQQSRLSI